MSVTLPLGNPGLGIEVLLCFISEKDRITSPDLLKMLFLTETRMVLVFLVTKAHCWLLFNFMTTRTPSESCFPVTRLQNITDPLTYSSTDARVCVFASLNFVRLLFAYFSNLSSGSTTVWCFSQFCIITNLLRLCSVPSSSSLMTMFNSTGSRTDPWGTLLMTGCWLDFMPVITPLWGQEFIQFSVHLTVHLYRLHFIQFVYEDVIRYGVIPIRLQPSNCMQSSNSSCLFSCFPH